MADKKGAIVITNLDGGRNGYDSPLNIPDDQCQEALNIDFWDAPCGASRLGATAVSISFSGGGGPFSGVIGSLIRHVPGDDETAAELWAVDAGTTTRIARMAGATTFAEVSLKDNLSASSDGYNVVGASLNGYLWLCYDSAGGNRLHVWDPSLSKVRRVGLATPAAAPTGATDGGAGLTFSRVYRVRWVDVSGSDVRRQSEASATLSMSITDDSGYTVTRPTAASEDETHWDLEAADTTAGPWYRLARTAIATTTYDDTNATIPTTNPSPTDGINYPPPSAKFIVATDARLVMANSFETSGGYVTPKNNRVWFTPVIGDNDIGDLERIPTGRYLDVEAAITGLAVLQGIIYVFSYRRIWKLVPTNDDTEPYAKYNIAGSVGCIRHQTIVYAEDEDGDPAIYFLSHRGPYRIGKNGVQCCGLDVVDIWETVNLAGTFFGLYHGDKKQVWWWVSTASGNATAIKIVFDTQRGRMDERTRSIRKGWVQHTGDSAIGAAAVMFSNTLAASMSRDLKPYVAQAGGSGRLWKCDDPSNFTDGSSGSMDCVLSTKEYAVGGLGHRMSVSDPLMVVSSRQSTAQLQGLTFYIFADFGLSNGSSQVSAWSVASGLAATKRAHVKVEGVQHSGAVSMAFKWITGRNLGSNSDCAVDAIEIPYTIQETS